MNFIYKSTISTVSLNFEAFTLSSRIDLRTIFQNSNWHLDCIWKIRTTFYKKP